MKKFYTLLAALLVALTAGAQNILPQGKEFAGVGDQVTSFDAIESGSLYVLQCNTADNGSYSYESGGKIFKGNDATAASLVKITKVEGQANTATIQTYSGAYYQTLVESQQVTVGANPANFNFVQSNSTFFLNTGNLYININGTQPTGKNRNNYSGGKSQYKVFKAVLQDATEHTYKLQVYGLPDGNNTTFALSGTAFTPGTPLTVSGTKSALDLTVANVPEGYEFNQQNSVALVASTNTFVVTFFCNIEQPTDVLGKGADYDAEKPATSLEEGKWYLIRNTRGSGDPNLANVRRILHIDSDNMLYMYGMDKFPYGNELTEQTGEYLFRFIKTDSTDQYFIQNANGKYFWQTQREQNGRGVQTEGHDSGFPYLIKQIGDNPGYFYIQCIATGAILDNNAGEHGTVVGWGNQPPATTDGNSVWQFIPVTLATELNSVTYIFKDSKTGDSIYTYTQRAMGGSTVVYNGPASNSMATFTTPANIENIDSNDTVYVTVTQNLPFIPSTSYDNATWYYWRTGKNNGAANKYLNYAQGTNNIPLRPKQETDAFQWAFIGSAFQGFKIVNKAAGPTMYLYASSNGNGTYPTMQANEQYWTLVAGATSTRNGNNTLAIDPNDFGYLFSFQMGNSYLNDYRGDGSLSFYTTGPVQDAGSNWFTELAGFTTYNVDLHQDGDSTYGTTYLPVATTVGEGVKAYTLNSVSDNTATLTELKGTIPANTGVILIGSADVTNATLTASAEEAAPVEGNLLEGFATPTTAGSDNYYLSELNGKIGLYTRSGDAANTVSVNKAYLPASAVGSGAKGFTFSFDTVTAISSVNAGKAGKAAGADAPRYNLAGQRVGKSYKGIVIAGGKKVLVK